MTTLARVAYFTMEIGLEAAMPTYAGGLGVLAGDTVRSAADVGLPLVAVTLLARKGYFRQRFDENGWQIEEPAPWRVEDYLAEMPQRVSVKIEGRTVVLRAWKYEVKGAGGGLIPVFFLDADLEGNGQVDRTLTDYLYGGDTYYRLCQEVILGIGGVRMLRALGYSQISRYHMNEGHSSLLVLELLAEQAKMLGDAVISEKHVEAVKSLCVFTTHTPVLAGHDQFSLELAHRVLGDCGPFLDRELQFCCEGVLNLTYLALDNSHYVNGVAKKHREVSRHMFAHYQIDSITNGVHVGTWACAPMQALFDRHVPGWREDNASLRYAISIPREELWEAHQAAKQALLDYVVRAGGPLMDPDVLTLGFARRATEYKRPDMLFRNLNRLKEICARAGPLQIVFAGKAHPRDFRGKELIQQVYRMKRALASEIKIAYLLDYNMEIARLIVAGADLWLNTPQLPLEASGTSGMKAAVNGVPSLSTLDGWWIEGCIEGVTGWAIGAKETARPDENEEELRSLYDRLEHVIMPRYYHERSRFVDVMRGAIALNGSFFNTERMLDQYVVKAYFK
jgi:glycogen phosphorylase